MPATEWGDSGPATRKQPASVYGLTVAPSALNINGFPEPLGAHVRATHADKPLGLLRVGPLLAILLRLGHALERSLAALVLATHRRASRRRPAATPLPPRCRCRLALPQLVREGKTTVVVARTTTAAAAVARQRTAPRTSQHGMQSGSSSCSWSGEAHLCLLTAR
eukprot:scaffold118963_cov57-Phaeocystis_antarctica.AAC.1